VGVDDVRADRPQSLDLVASALAGKTVAVAQLPPGQPAWTDGQTIYVDGSAAARARLEAVAVQASLIAAGSLDPDVMRSLVRHGRLARRYLAIEAHRAVVANADLLPRPLMALGSREIAGRSDSPQRSLSIAGGREAIDEQAAFGVIRPSKVLAIHAWVATQQDPAAPQHVPRSDSARQLD